MIIVAHCGHGWRRRESERRRGQSGDLADGLRVSGIFGLLGVLGVPAADGGPNGSSSAHGSTARLLNLLMKESEYSEGEARAAPVVVVTASMQTRQVSFSLTIARPHVAFKAGLRVLTFHRCYQVEGNHRLGLRLCTLVTVKWVADWVYID